MMLNSAILLTILSPYTALIPAAAMLYIAYKNKSIVWLNPLNLSIILIFGWSFMSGILNKSWMDLLMSMGILLYLGTTIHIQNNYHDMSRVESLIKKIWKLSILTGLIGFIEKGLSYVIDMRWVSDLFWSPTYIPTKEAYRIYSTFGNPNVAGDWFAALFLIGLFFIRKTEGAKRLGYGIGTLIFLLAAIFTGSKGAALGLEIGVLAFAFMCDSRRGKIVLGMTFIGVIILALLLPEMNHTMNSRAAIWNECMDLANDKPFFGWGLLGIYEQTGEIHGHNMWVSMLGMLGVGGLSLFMGIIVSLFRNVQVLQKHNNQLVPLLVSIMAMILAHGVVDFTVLTPQGGMLFIVTAGLLSAMALKYERHHALDEAFMKELATYIDWHVFGNREKFGKPPVINFIKRASN